MNNKKSHLQRGINIMAAVLPLLILSPVLVNIGFKALQKDGIYGFLIVGILLAIATIILFVLGIRALLSHLFKD
ncbi:hypothetical protein AXE80_05025 [Wenyingzhuangia fucanilytica]|uniref:Uncharacterized protein n=1 Tax=Wenyingzhuangia fucanilytica TaxID=1790137 RepID=A0A1B1Y4G9_9FLAO|nr:DUF6095 family protein [Wenyingzhuangia fucanilytica]ANW95676.1 hypothetical protein AXE80_05025 [Wenyingzhuangia fucanilytica]